MEQFITHENLKRVIEEIYGHEDNPDAESLSKLIAELVHSTLILAASFTEDNFSLTAFSYEGGDYAVLFTDMDEFRKAFPKGETGSLTLNFRGCVRMVEKGMIEGFIINPESASFLFGKALIEDISRLPEDEFSLEKAYSASEVRSLEKSLDNTDLEEFIENPDNVGRYWELFEKISHSLPLALRLCDEDMSESEDDGMIDMSKTGPIGYLHSDEIGGSYATLFTSEEKMAGITSDKNRYVQIVSFYQMVHHVLCDDRDGIIINPGCENILLTRDVLLEWIFDIQDLCYDERLNSLIFYMFPQNIH